MIHLDYRDVRPIYTQIFDGFREQIVTGLLRSGDKMPSVRELASQLAINPNTIQRAYRQLEMDGWIATVPGKGCFVCGSLTAMDKETERWLQKLDEAVQALKQLGMTPEKIADRVRKE